MSKFLKLCEQVRCLLEQENADPNAQPPGTVPAADVQQPASGEVQAPQPDAGDTTEGLPEKSEQPVVSPDQFAALARAMAKYYSENKTNLTSDQITRIKNLPITDKPDEKTIEKIYITLTNIFDPTATTNTEASTNPETVKNVDNPNDS
jgi:hypothetical protein